MKLIVTIFIISSSYKLVANQQLNPTQDETKIVHDAHSFHDQEAQNSVDIPFGSRNLRQFDQSPKSYKPAYFQSNDAQTGYPENHNSYSLVPNVPHNSPTSQSFNVGYSVKFGNVRPMPMKQRNYLNSDIITGSPKEEVVKPESADVRREEYVFNSFLDSKRQKISGIKPKYHRPTSSNLDASQLLAQANLSPKTRKKLSELQGTKYSDYESDEYIKTVNDSPWKILSPGVEIFESKSVSPIVSDHSDYEANSNRFDHAKALGRSIGFDYTNVMTDTKRPHLLPNLHNRENIEDTSYENSRNEYGKDFPLEDSTQGSIKTNNYLGIGSESDSKLLGEPLLSHSNIITNGNAEHVPEYTDSRILHKNSQHDAAGTIKENYYLENYPSSIKSFGNDRIYASKPVVNNANDKLKYTNVINENSQIEILNRNLENLYKFNERNPNLIHSQRDHRQKNVYHQQRYQIPVADFSKSTSIQQYLAQPNNVAGPTNHMYNVQETQPEIMANKSNELYGNIVYGKKYSNIYIPYNNLHGNENGRLKKVRPSSRFVKEVQRHFRPPSRNKARARMEMY